MRGSPARARRPRLPFRRKVRTAIRRCCELTMKIATAASVSFPGGGKTGWLPPGCWSSEPALGNEVLKNLALVGVGTTYLIDLDVIEPSNLSRSVLFRADDAGQSKAKAAARRACDSIRTSPSCRCTGTSSPIWAWVCSLMSTW